MNSISISDPIIDIRNLGLSFKTDLYRAWTLRDVFTNAFSHPFSLLGPPPDRLTVFDNLNLKIFRGQRVGFLGVNGTGKTSLCRCIAGIYRPSRGDILLGGKVRAVFDTSVGVHPELTGRENARLLAEFIYPEFYKEHDQMVAEALEFSELGKFLDVPYRLYSNGMQARLCLSIVSCRPSDILILDEVFDGADIFFREKISARIMNIVKTSGAVIFVSHSFEQLRQVCNRLVVFDKGHIVFDGDVEKGIQVYSSLRGSHEGQ